MANWSSISYSITGDKEDLTKLFNTLVKCKAKSPDGFGIHEFMSELQFIPSTTKVDGRGYITTFSKCTTKDGEVYIDIEASWAWSHDEYYHDWLIEQMPSLDIYYIEIEPGEDIYCKHDPTGKFYPAKYLLVDSNDLYVFCKDEAEVVEVYNQHYTPNKKTFESVKKAIERRNKAKNGYIYLHEIEDE